MDLADALEGDATQQNLSTQNAAWPEQPQNPVWPGQPGGQPYQPWPGQQPNMPSWPNQPNQPGWPNAPGWPGQGPPTAPQNVPLTVPLEMPLPMGVYNKLLITIQGVPNPNAKGFAINLVRNNDVAFHFNPRFDDEGIKALVRNSMINNEWGKEERIASSFPFAPGSPFEIKILCTPDDYKVAVNKAHLFEYKHRILELNQINRLTVFNDVTLQSVNFETLP